jgi:hypothetical protein
MEFKCLSSPKFEPGDNPESYVEKTSEDSFSFQALKYSGGINELNTNTSLTLV